MINMKTTPVRDLANDLIEYDGSTKTLKEWCYLLDLEYSTVRMRRTRGMEPPELFAGTVHGFTKQGKTFILSGKMFARLEHHGRRLRQMPTELMVSLVEHGLSKLDKNEHREDKQASPNPD